MGNSGGRDWKSGDGDREQDGPEVEYGESPADRDNKIRILAATRRRAGARPKGPQREAMWEAEEWNQAHPEWVAEFIRLTGRGCTDSLDRSRVDRFLLANWQSARGLKADGKIGPKTLEVANARATGASAPPAERAGEPPASIAANAAPPVAASSSGAQHSAGSMVLPGGALLEVDSGAVEKQGNQAVIRSGTTVRIASPEEYEAAKAEPAVPATNSAKGHEPPEASEEPEAEQEHYEVPASLAMPEGEPPAAIAADEPAAAPAGLISEKNHERVETAKDVAEFSADWLTIPKAILEWKEAPPSLVRLAKAVQETRSMKVLAELMERAAGIAEIAASPIKGILKYAGKGAHEMLKAAAPTADRMAAKATRQVLKSLKKGRQYTMEEIAHIAEKKTARAAEKFGSKVARGARSVVTHEVEKTVTRDAVVAAEKKGVLVAADKEAAATLAKTAGSGSEGGGARGREGARQDCARAQYRCFIGLCGRGLDEGH